jgi:hypothetical protein
MKPPLLHMKFIDWLTEKLRPDVTHVQRSVVATPLNCSEAYPWDDAVEFTYDGLPFEACEDYVRMKTTKEEFLTLTQIGHANALFPVPLMVGTTYEEAARAVVRKIETDLRGAVWLGTKRSM